MNILDLICYINIQITKYHNHEINLDHFKPVLKDTKIKDLINLLEHEGYFGSFRVTNKSIYYVHKGTVNV